MRDAEAVEEVVIMEELPQALRREVGALLPDLAH